MVFIFIVHVNSINGVAIAPALYQITLIYFNFLVRLRGLTPLLAIHQTRRVYRPFCQSGARL